MIYSIGLADYFLDSILEKLIKFCFDMLTTNGVLIIAHKDIDADKQTPIAFDWLADWKFVPRNERQFLKIIKRSGIKNYSVSIEREKSKTIFFVKIIKKE